MRYEGNKFTVNDGTNPTSPLRHAFLTKVRRNKDTLHHQTDISRDCLKWLRPERVLPKTHKNGAIQ